MISSDLVFDLGLDNGDDTSFYLAKGLRAVAVEANPELVEAGLHKVWFTCQNYCLYGEIS